MQIVLTLILALLLIGGCNTGTIDKLTFNEIKEHDFDLMTPIYGVRIEIDSRISESKYQMILMRIDIEIAKTYVCLFGDADELPFMIHHVIYEGCRDPQQNLNKQSIETLRIYVNKNSFHCFKGSDDFTSKICQGWYNARDIIVIERSLLFLGHELAHREGMCFDHSNESDFTICPNIVPTELRETGCHIEGSIQ